MLSYQCVNPTIPTIGANALHALPQGFELVRGLGRIDENGGWGQIYLGCYKDGDGNFLDGGKHYTLHIPADANYAELFWTITAYNTENRAIIANETKRADVGSNVEGTVHNEDGSFTFHFAPEKPEDVPAANWVQTNRGEGWFVYFRAYSPTKEFVDRQPGTIVPNLERVQ